MAFIKAKNLYRELAAESVIGRGEEALRRSRCFGTLQEALDGGRQGKPGGIRPEEFSLRDLAANLIVNRSDGRPAGQEFIQEMFDPTGQQSMQEAMAAVDNTMFVGITGQILINRLMARYTAEEFVLSQLVPTIPTRLNGERIPGVYFPRDPGKDVTIVKEGQEFPHVGFGEEYIETPATTKHGLIIPVTKEAVFFDRTGLVLQRADSVGELLGLQKEKRLINVVIGAANNYREKRYGDNAPVDLNTFASATDSGRWVNHFDGNGLVDYTNIDYCDQRFAEMTDPNTGEPIIIGKRWILAPAQMKMRLQQIASQTQLWKLTNSQTLWTGSTNFPAVGGVGKNMVSDLGFATSAQLYAQLKASLGLSATDAQGYWFYGDIEKAFAYMENWPITVVQAPMNSEADFAQDIPFRFKASERGAAAVMEPRAWLRNRTLSTSSSSGTAWSGTATD
jgi:hypothetical protein